MDVCEAEQGAGVASSAKGEHGVYVLRGRYMDKMCMSIWVGITVYIVRLCHIDAVVFFGV